MRRRRAPLALAAATALALTGGALAQTPERADLAAERQAVLAAAAGWHDALEAHRAPERPTPTDSESAILVLAGPPAVDAAPRGRAAAARAISSSQEGVARTLAELGATVTFRYRVLVNAVAVRVPAGRLPAVAALPEVRAVIPVGYLAPAQATEAAPDRVPADPRARPPKVPSEAADEPARPPAHIALIDAGIDAAHPWLGGGIGPTNLVLGGADLVDGDDDPTAESSDRSIEAHGTQMASLVLSAPALAGLPPDAAPRLLSYRVVAPEAVAGRWRPLARTDRVLAALERAVDPDRDGDPRDRAEVILLGLAGRFGGGGVDPVAEAVAAADRAGAFVVVPAGNDGPTNGAAGSVGAVASVPTAMTVGAMAADRTRRARLEIEIGPARARLDELPALGAASAMPVAPVVLLQGPEGPAPGDDPREYRSPDGRSLVQGAIAVVGRGGAPIARKAESAAAAGAAGLLVWDLEDPAVFPGALSRDDGILPVAGLGPRQGQALADLLRRGADVRGRVVETDPAAGPAAVASFSSRGPTAGGRPKPDLVAPGVARRTAWPGEGGTGVLTGTSAAAAEVAARALRLRVDRPELGPRQVHSLLVQGARRLRVTPLDAQGAGAVGPAVATMALDPPLVLSDSAPRRVTIRFVELGGASGRYRVELRAGGAPRTLATVAVAAGARTQVAIRLPAGARGRLVVVPADGGDPVAHAPVVPRRAPGTPTDALGRPRVATGGGSADVRIRVGTLERRGGRVAATRLHDLRLALVPVGGGAPQALTHSAKGGPVAQGTYRFLIASRMASGLEVKPGRYRLRATASGPDGRRLRTESGPFRIARP